MGQLHLGGHFCQFKTHMLHLPQGFAKGLPFVDVFYGPVLHQQAVDYIVLRLFPDGIRVGFIDEIIKFLKF